MSLKWKASNSFINSEKPPVNPNPWTHRSIKFNTSLLCFKMSTPWLKLSSLTWTTCSARSSSCWSRETRWPEKMKSRRRLTWRTRSRLRNKSWVASTAPRPSKAWSMKVWPRSNRRSWTTSRDKPRSSKRKRPPSFQRDKSWTTELTKKNRWTKKSQTRTVCLRVK